MSLWHPEDPNQMKLKSDTPLRLLLAGAVTLLAASQAGAATVITANGTPWADNTKVNAFAGFGSNVTNTGGGHYTVSAGATGVVGTPDITLAFLSSTSGGWDQYTNWNGRGNVIQMEANPGAQFLTFTPTATQAVRLTSADFDLWSGGGNMTITWTVTGETSGQLATGTWNRSTGGRDVVSFNNATGSLGEVVTLTLARSGGDYSYFAIDNLAFDQVPEASTALLSIAGLGAMALRRRRA